ATPVQQVALVVITQPPKKVYLVNHPLCTVCNHHHLPIHPCKLCTYCNCFGQFATNYRVAKAQNNQINQINAPALTAPRQQMNSI
ncbi:hypothetical protein R6Q57_010154, partial [Mikania cordata]